MQVNTNQVDTNIKVPVVFAQANAVEIPLTSQATNKIFEEMGQKAPDPKPELGRSVTNLKTAVANLADAKKHSVRDKIIGCLIIAAAVALFVISILIMAKTLGTVGFDLGYPLMWVGILGNAPAVPILTRVEACENSIKYGTQEVQVVFEKHLPEMVNYYRNNHKKIEDGLDKMLTDTRQSLEIIQGPTVAVKTPAGEKELTGRIQVLENAQKEFVLARDFYAKYNAIVPAAA